MAFQIEDTTNVSKKSKKTKNYKKSKKGSKRTRLHFILDESGSMSSCWQSTIDGFNEYINGLRQDKSKNKYIVSLTKFEGGAIKSVFRDIPLKKVRDITTDDFIPGGSTNLNDAIGTTLKEMELNELKKKHNTLVIIMTDGYENASREWTQESVAKLIKQKEKDGWTVTFLGANIDTQAVSKGYSISAGNARSYSTKGMKNTMRNMSEATVMYASSAMDGVACMDVFGATGLSDEDWMTEDDDTAILGSVDINRNLAMSNHVSNDELVNTLNIVINEAEEEDEENV